MARKPKTISVYERIENKKDEIVQAEELLKKLNEELQVLLAEKDNLEMRQLLENMKLNGLTIDKAIELLQSKTKK